VNCHSELMEDSLGNIEPVQLGVEQMCQASVMRYCVGCLTFDTTLYFALLKDLRKLQ